MIETIVLALAFAIAAAAMAVAFIAERRSRLLGRELRGLTRSLDSALRQADGHRRRDMARIDEANRGLNREIAEIATRLRSGESGEEAAPALATDTSNVIAHPAVRSARRSARIGIAAREGGFEDRLAAAVEAGRLELSLQPVVSISRGEAIAFEAFASIGDEGGVAAHHLRRPSATTLDLIAFERTMVREVIATARQRLGSMSESMPLHVAISEALLESGDDVAEIRNMLELHPGIARSVVISVPAVTIRRRSRHLETLHQLHDCGLRIAVEGWASDLEEIAGTLPVAQIKLDKDAILGNAPKQRRVPTRRALVEAAAAVGAEIVAIDVDSDEDAVRLMEIGVDVMAGGRFAAPRRLAGGEKGPTTDGAGPASEIL